MSCPRYNIDGADNITLANIGGGAGVFAQRVGDEFQLNSLVAGTDIQITPGVGTITITSLAGGAATLQSAYDNGDTIALAANTPVTIGANGATFLHGEAVNIRSPGAANSARYVSNAANPVLPAGGNVVIPMPPPFIIPFGPAGNFTATLKLFAQAASGPEAFEIRVVGTVVAGVWALTAPPQITSVSNPVAFPAGLTATVAGGPSIQVTLTGGPGNQASSIYWDVDMLFSE